MTKKILYITYDGLTDPLGQSQILPYLKGLAAFGYQFTILSFEKKDRLQKEGDLIRKLTSESGIRWVPLSFTTNPPMLSKFYDAIRMKRVAVNLHKKEQFDMVHCRSYIAADVGLFLKRKFGVRFFFDMRGFWADEKKDGSWNVANPIYRSIYNYYKSKEALYLKYADQIISLTHAGKREMMNWPAYNNTVDVSVIPCCADMDHFSLTNAEQKKASKLQLGIYSETLVVSYLGSIGTWYMLDEMLQCFQIIKEEFNDAKFLFLTHSDPQLILQKLVQYGIKKTDVIIKEASRKEVPGLIKASDINISFIKPVYSKISSSPTKLGEVLSIGIPVICNSGVGDVESIVNHTQSGFVIQQFNTSEYKKAAEKISGLLQKDPNEIRTAAESIYSLEKGIELYKACYQKVLI
jgi:glycosyltransferase involved in cell wall biosynthesis